jgi:hypothetical protein
MGRTPPLLAHTTFNIHSRVRPKTKTKAERVGEYMILPLLSLERLPLDEGEGQVGYRYDQDTQEMERMDDLEFIAQTTSHIPDKGQVTVRYYGLSADAYRGGILKASLGVFPLRMAEDKPRPTPFKRQAEMIRRVYEVDPPPLSSMWRTDEGQRLSRRESRRPRLIVKKRG